MLHNDEKKGLRPGHILKEQGGEHDEVPAGVHRIEAVTGTAAQRLVQDRLNVLDEAAAYLAYGITTTLEPSPWSQNCGSRDTLPSVPVGSATPP